MEPERQQALAGKSIETEPTSHKPLHRNRTNMLDMQEVGSSNLPSPTITKPLKTKGFLAIPERFTASCFVQLSWTFMDINGQNRA